MRDKPRKTVFDRKSTKAGGKNITAENNFPTKPPMNKWRYDKKSGPPIPKPKPLAILVYVGLVMILPKVKRLKPMAVMM